ncbi:MAG TPA: cell division protein SepF, partial [Oscillatoriaceae cyanobacterium]
MSAEIWSKVKNALGFEDEEPEYVEAPEEDYQPQPAAPRATRLQTPLTTPAPTSPANRAGNIIGLPSTPNSEVVVIEPRSFDEALAILDNLRSRKAVILNLMGLAPDQSQRLVDFVSGA